MKLSKLGFLSLVLACSMWVGEAIKHVVHTAFVTVRAVKNYLVDAFMATASDKTITKAVVPFVRAKAFVLRLAKRERPVLTNSWRMCPSI